MENFKEIAEKCLAGELSGIFVTAFGNKWHSRYLQRYAILGHEMPSQYVLGPGVIYNSIGQCESRKEVRIIDFIPDDMQKQIKIDIPEGKVPVMEQTENGVVITWKEKELTYNDISNYIWEHGTQIGVLTSTVVNENTTKFSKKVEVLRKLTNIRNYFGKPKHLCDGVVIKCVNSYCGVETGQFYFDKPDLDSLHEVVFAKREHAEQAIKMLGDDLKYLFEPW